MNSNNKKRHLGPIFLGLFLLVAFITLLNSLVITNEREYTLIRQFGKVKTIVADAGLSFKIPYIQSSDTLPNKTLVYDLPASDVITRDKKTMVADSYVLWKIQNPLKFVQSLNAQIANAEARINTTVYNSIKNTIGNQPQADVISGRDGKLTEEIMENLGSNMEQYGIKILSIETKKLDLPSDNKAAVYERMISERNNIAASYTAEGNSEAQIIKNETDTTITMDISKAKAEAEKTKASGEAEYMKILAKAYSDKSKSDFYTFVRSLDAAKASLIGENKTLILSSDSPLAQIFNHVK